MDEGPVVGQRHEQSASSLAPIGSIDPVRFAYALSTQGVCGSASVHWMPMARKNHLTSLMEISG